MRFASLGSGSKGNATLIESGAGSKDTRILLDCGFSVVEFESRLSKLEREAHSITAIVITHEHSDHVSGAGRLSRKYNIPVWLTVGTFNACRDNKFYKTNFLDCHNPFQIEDIALDPFPVPHDAKEPCQFIFSDGDSRLGIVTDLGSHSPHVVCSLSNLDALLLECNYDRELLLNGPYPNSLKQRVVGDYGHLDNKQSADLLNKIDTSKLKHVVGMHVSEKNNLPEYAQAALSRGLNCKPQDVLLACQKNGFDWCEI